MTEVLQPIQEEKERWKEDGCVEVLLRGFVGIHKKHCSKQGQSSIVWID